MFTARSLSCTLRCLALAATLGAASGAHADVLYTQPYAGTGEGGWQSTTLGGAVPFDSFVLAQDATVSSVSWYGVGLLELYGITPVNPPNFTIGFYGSDANGKPGDLLSFSTIGNSAGATATGTLLGLTLYSYSASLPTTFQATAGTTYWLSISDPANSLWFWATGSGGDGTHVADFLGDIAGTYQDDLAFSLQDVSAVPEPASYALLLGGLVAVLGARARQRRNA